jgi:hypothetical protein
MAAKMITLAQAAANLRAMFPHRVVYTWLQEFGYMHNADDRPADGLEWALTERGARIRRELVIHAKRLADRQTMGQGRVVSRSSVIK